MAESTQRPPPANVPASKADITAQWLEQALAEKVPGIVAEGFSLEQIGEGYGLASQIYRCKLPADKRVRGVIIKLWPIDGPAGTREVEFYRTFGGQLGARIPACYHAGLDSELGRGVLIVEDLGNVTQGDDTEHATLAQARSIARSLAGVHATWLNSETLDRAEWVPSVASWQRDAEWFASRREVFLRGFGDRLDGPARRLLDQIEKAQAASNQRLANASMTLLHEDFHLDNIVFVDGSQPVILDWARCSMGPLALDLYELLFRIGQPEDRDRILDSYLSEFEHRNEKALVRADVWRQLGGAFLRKFGTNTCGIANWQPATEREAALIDVSIQRTLDALNFWREFDPDLFAFLDDEPYL